MTAIRAKLFGTREISRAIGKFIGLQMMAGKLMPEDGKRNGAVKIVAGPRICMKLAENLNMSLIHQLVSKKV